MYRALLQKRTRQAAEMLGEEEPDRKRPKTNDIVRELPNSEGKKTYAAASRLRSPVPIRDSTRHALSFDEAMELLKTLPLRSDSGVRYVRGKYTVRAATFTDNDIPHCSSRIDTISQLHQNTQAMLWSISLFADSPFADLGFKIVKRLAVWSARRLALLKEFDLVAAAQVVLRRMGERNLVVRNTFILLEMAGKREAVEVGEVSPRQREMRSFAARYHGDVPVQTEGSSSECDEEAKNWREQMAEYAERYHWKRTYL